MGNYPKPRVNFTKAFLHTGVDFAGPFNIKWNSGRGNKTIKVYIAVFVCLAVKAIHFEIVGDLTTEAFIAALTRFVSRRGPVAHLYSDNATNFVGAFRKLKDIMEKVEKMDLKWSFIPPSAPHFGGLWEAGVKSLKTQMKKNLSSNLSKLTWEELSTILCGIEGCLNSRPLCPMYDDVSNLDVLTPNHFLTGAQFVPLPEPDTKELSLRTRWERVCRLHQEVSSRYKSEYVSRMQSRGKWQRQQKNLAIGQLVLIKEDGSPSTEWPMGRVTAVHPGQDGTVRVVTLLTRKGVIRRPVVKLAPLPCDAAYENNPRP